jgi:class 3 adenylate cyclase/tetratricopeptide (TPR) repeat protein
MAGGTSRRERKVVSVVFCDLVGFTARAESMDPEDVEALLRPYHERVRSELERHGGTVEKFIGDAVMALFGAPTAHEDDAERAVRAALAIRDFALEEDLELRVGITTGEALVRLDARPEVGEGMASGDVVNTAARLQSAAPVNGILVDETTYRATRHVVEHEDVGPVDAKGKAAPIPVWQARAARTRFGVDVAHDARVELVGRERELSIVRDAFGRAVHERVPQLLTLVGVPGIGKSRLVYELRRIARDDEELITWRQGRCLAYGEGVTLWALGEIVKAQAGILEQDTPAEVEEKVRATSEALLEPGDVRWVEQHLLALVGLAEEAELGGDRRGEAFAAWRRFLEGLAEVRPLVVVFEDVHWADDSLLDFVDELVDWVSDAPLLVVATARPELLERRPGWGGGKLNAATLALSPLSDEQTAQLIAALLDRPVLPADTQQALLERVGGNPLYAEQFADLYRERGSTEEFTLPETLQGIIAARLDALDADEKSLLLDAAVVGKVFWPSSLGRDGRETSEALHALERKGFVRRQRRSSVEGQTELAFAHALVRDVAYGQIPRADRAAKHQCVAEWIESLGRPEDHAELRAHHWRSALKLARASGREDTVLAERTRLALRDAGDRAASLNNHPSAASLYEEALVLWPEDDPGWPDLLYRHAHALFLADDEHAEAALERARDELLAAEDRDAAAEAELTLSRVAWNRGESERARAHELRAEELAEGRSSATSARVLAYVARTLAIKGDSEQALGLAREALSGAEAHGIADLQAHALATIGLAKHYLGDPTGPEDERRALELAMEANSPLAWSIANNVATQAFFEFDFTRAAAAFDEGAQIAERFGDRAGVRWLRMQRAALAHQVGHWDDALTLLDEFIAECEEKSPHYGEARCRADRARILQARGAGTSALAECERALGLAGSLGDAQSVAPSLGGVYAVFEAEGLLDEARAVLPQILALTRIHAPVVLIALAFDVTHTRLATEFGPQLWEALDSSPPWGWRDAASAALERDFVRAAQLWADAGSPTWEARLRLRAAEDLIERGRRAEGEAQAAQALEFYTSVGATFFVERCGSLVGEARTA